MVESLDNGKSIRETRDADIPLVVRHFYHHAGWAQLMDTEMAEWKSVGRSVHSLPLVVQLLHTSFNNSWIKATGRGIWWGLY